MIIYSIGQSGQRLIFCDAVVERFRKYRQLKWWSREAGGQLFARFSMPDIVVEEATGPRRSDWRTRTSYRPNRLAEQKEIISRHARGLHFIGDWHTHPEPIASPSTDDSLSMSETVSRSRHELNAFVMVIVGQSELPGCLSVSLVPRGQSFSLQLEYLDKTEAPCKAQVALWI
jgi:integrative and conjugative element protein (TIGR02256 family)